MDCGLEGLTFTQPSLAKPQFADECSIGNIVKRFIRTGELPQMRQRPTIADATNIPDDFFEAMRPAVEVRQAFDQQPLEVRNKFNNDPEEWFAAEVASRDSVVAPGSPEPEPEPDPEPEPGPDPEPAHGSKTQV